MDPENQLVTNSDVASKATERDKEEECSVCVAVNIRPLVGNELVEGCQERLDVDAAQAQVFSIKPTLMFHHWTRFLAAERIFFSTAFTEHAMHYLQRVFLVIAFSPWSMHSLKDTTQPFSLMVKREAERHIPWVPHSVRDNKLSA